MSRYDSHSVDGPKLVLGDRVRVLRDEGRIEDAILVCDWTQPSTGRHREPACEGASSHKVADVSHLKKR